MGELVVRQAIADDADVVAALHAESWRRSYRGIYSDSFLDGDVLSDRRHVWARRLAASVPTHFTLVAELDGVIVGFIYVVLDNDPRWGAVVQNLHVATEKKRQGVGSRLLTDAARAVLGSRPTSGMYVFVREDNAPARSFYAARAGAAVESTLGGPFPDGRRASVVRYAWLDLSLLTESTA